MLVLLLLTLLSRVSCVVTDVSREWFGERRPMASCKASLYSAVSIGGICTMHVCLHAMHICMYISRYILASRKASLYSALLVCTGLSIGGFAPCMHALCNAYVQCMYRYIFEEAIGLSQGLS